MPDEKIEKQINPRGDGRRSTPPAGMTGASSGAISTIAPGDAGSSTPQPPAGAGDGRHPAQSVVVTSANPGDGHTASHHPGEYHGEAVQPVHPIVVEGSRPAAKTDKAVEVIVETPVSLTVNGEVWLTFMCTPVNIEALALGFLFNEGLLKSLDEVAQVHVCAAGDNVDVWLDHAVEQPSKWRRTSGCTGGMTSVDAEMLEAVLPDDLVGYQAGDTVSLSAADVTQMVETLFDKQDLYRRSGGVHTSIMTDCRDVLAVGEDIGRHNTLDKLAGRCLLDGIPPKACTIITTGRISSEMIQKAARLGAAIVISRTSPSSLSVRLAERWGITLIGYARRNRFIIYAHPGRILLDPPNQSE